MSIKQKILLVISIFMFLYIGRIAGIFFTRTFFDLELEEITDLQLEQDLSLDDDAEIIFEPQDISTEERIRVLVVNVNTANIRENRGTTSEIIKRVNRGDYLMPLDFFRSWWRVRLPDGTIGWIFRDLTAYRRLPVEKWKEYFDEDLFKELDKEKEDNIIHNLSENYINVVVNLDILNVRLSYSTAYQVIGRIYKNDVLSLVGFSNNWAKVILNNGMEGWVFSDYLKIAKKDNETGELLLLNFTDNNIRRLTFATGQVKYSNTSIRSGAGNQYSSLSFINREAIFQIIAEYNEFYFIYFDDIMGWIHEDFITIIK